MKNLQHLEINLNNLKYNIINLKSLLSSDTMFMAVVKANAYGHGIVECARAAVDGGANWLGVVNINEALELRKQNIKVPILVLGYVDSSDFNIATINNISVPIFDMVQVEYLQNFGHQLSKKLKVHLKIETGLNRLGFSVITNNKLDTSSLRKIINNLNKSKMITIEGIYSHLSSVEEDLYTTHGQNDLFKDAINDLSKHNINIPVAHLAASAAAMLLPETHYNMVRCGISIYGLWPSDEVKKAFLISHNNTDFLKPVLSYKTRIVQIKNVEKREKIGYGRTHTVKNKTVIAIIPVGYAEGLDRGLSNPGGSGQVLINGQCCPIVGRICMNMSIIDVSKLKTSLEHTRDKQNLKLKTDEVILIGRQGDEEITIEDWAYKMGTINYEVITKIPEGIKRIYI